MSESMNEMDKNGGRCEFSSHAKLGAPIQHDNLPLAMLPQSSCIRGPCALRGEKTWVVGAQRLRLQAARWDRTNVAARINTRHAMYLRVSYAATVGMLFARIAERGMCAVCAAARASA